MASPTLEQLLVQTQLVSSTQVAIAQKDAQMRRKRLAPAIIDLGLVDERRFAEWIARQANAPLVNPILEADVERHVRRLPRALAREFEVVPVALSQEELSVATVNPLDSGFVEVLRAATGLHIRPVVAVRSDLTRLIAKFYPEDETDPTMFPVANATVALSDTGREDTNPAPPLTIDQQLARLSAMVDDLQQRVATMERTLSRVLPQS